MPDSFGPPKYVWVSKIPKICLVSKLGKQLPKKRILLLQILFEKMVLILISVTQHEQYFFLFWHMFLLSAYSSQSHARSSLSLTSHHWINNKCNRVKGWCWRWLIYAQRNFLLHNMSHVSRSNHHCSWKFHKFHRKIPVLESLFSLK